MLVNHPDVDMSLSEQYSNAPLHMATRHAGADVEVVRLILSHPDTDINAENNSGTTALYGAIETGYKEAVDELFKHPQLNVNHVDKYIFKN